MDIPLRVLIVEDSDRDVALEVRALKAAGYQVTYAVAETAAEMKAALAEQAFDVIISDHDLPQFNAFGALAVLKQSGMDIPFIIVSGAIGEEAAVSAMVSGAHDYVMKNNLTRLVPAIQRELKEAESRRERKRSEENLKKKDEELLMISQQLLQVEKLATMGELSASIAHELNNPLAIVSLRVESLINNLPEDSIGQRELKIVLEEVERMGNLVANLLQFSRRGQKQISTVDIREEIEKVLELVYYHLRKHNIVIWREFAKEAPHIQADRQQLQQVFLNLFTNASDAMPEGGTLTIRVAAPPESMQVIVEIADTGTGIPPEILPRIAEPFFSTKPEGKGTGLGLAICRRIIKEHNGTFDLVSEGITGKGTTVRISLPVKKGEGLST